jgi:hypothetical protein
VEGIRFLCPVGGELLPAESFAFAHILVLTLLAQLQVQLIRDRSRISFVSCHSRPSLNPCHWLVAAAGTAATR